MQSTQNQSKLEVLFGPEVGANEQSSFRLNLQIGKQKAKDQAVRVKELLNNQGETATSLVIVLPCAEANQEKLVQLLDGVFKGTTTAIVPKDFNTHVTAGRILHTITKTKDKVMLLVRPAGEMVDVISGPVEMVTSGPGMKEIIQNQLNSVTLEVKSANTFKEIDEFMGKGESFASAVLKSLKARLVLDIHQNLLDGILEILEGIDPALTNSPLGFLQFFKSFNLETTFASSDELPQGIKAELMKEGKLKEGFSISEKESDADKKFWKGLAKVVEPGVEVYVTIENLLALTVQAKLPALGTHLAKNLKK